MAGAGAPLKGKRGAGPESPKEIAFPGAAVQSRGMTKLCITGGTLVGGYLGGYLCSNLGMMTEVIVSGIGSIVGVYLGWKLARWIER